MLTDLHIVCFSNTKTEFRDHDRYYMALEEKKVYCLSLLRKKILPASLRFSSVVDRDGLKKNRDIIH